ncbi:MAG TPA: Rne/Rng family ribonuclease, partial [Allosphingosinicella sp.]|nr:Rne/Rng family ribonuclease [Allosphingosinicella sp.]
DDSSDDEEGLEGGEEVGTGSSRSPVDESAADELRRKRQNLRRRYKIQDVIRRRQVLLVQVVKEERGNKGAALTTYLSLAGRYCVLMPNTSHGGGISRKISSGADRKRLKQIMADLALPMSMGLIVRTAGMQRTKTEIKRDFDYLARLWDEIREKTLKSSAPALIYGDSDLIKRAIRDIYNRDIDEVIVEGEEGHRAARNFMKLLMPSHVRRVKHYVDPVPLFQRHGVEDQLGGMYQPIVQLKSGGYLVINPTEALVSIDINSGRSTREHNIEQTAYATNLEAAAEIARQLRLRDMAGLVVIDFIDMESNGHVRKVEKAMKEALKNDRARIQVGRISSFGLMEMSRQRLRTGVLEASTRPCAHCEGTGLMRTASSAGLSALRMLEDEAARGRGSRIVLRAGREAAVYVLNKKRRELGEVEERYGVEVDILIDESFEGARMSVESFGPPPAERPRFVAAPAVEEEDLDEDYEAEEEAEDEAPAEERGARAPREAREPRDDEDDKDRGRGRRRRRRGRRGGRRRPGEGEGEGGEYADRPGEDEDSADEAAEAGEKVEAVTEEAAAEAPAAEEKPRGRRRPRARKEEAAPAEAEAAAAEPPAEAPADASPEAEEATAPAPRRGRRRKAVPSEAEAAGPVAEEPAPAAEPEAQAPESAPATPTAANDEEAPAKKPRRGRAKAVSSDAEGAAKGAKAGKAAKAAPKAPEAPMLDRQATPEGADAGDDEESGPPRRGWWQRTFGA